MPFGKYVDICTFNTFKRVHPGQKGDCAIHICRTRAASAATIVLTATAALEPSTMSPMRSRVGRRLETRRLGSTPKLTNNQEIQPQSDSLAGADPLTRKR
ncbi:MAG: hypothetical protein WCF14_09460 [Nitrososphaeraceae archaeon]